MLRMVLHVSGVGHNLKEIVPWPHIGSNSALIHRHWAWHFAVIHAATLVAERISVSLILLLLFLKNVKHRDCVFKCEFCRSEAVLHLEPLSSPNIIGYQDKQTCFCKWPRALCL